MHTLGPVEVTIWKGPSCSLRPFAIVSVLEVIQDHLELSPLSESATTGKPFKGRSTVSCEYVVYASVATMPTIIAWIERGNPSRKLGR